MSRNITATKNYRLFSRSQENRPVDLRKHRDLEDSMKKYGYLFVYPIVCIRSKTGSLIVKDGQHRLDIAEKLGLTVFYTVTEEDFDIAEINNTQRIWTTRDYVLKWKAAGLKDYGDALDFADRFHLPLGVSIAMLSGTVTFGNVVDAFRNGKFKIKDLEWADQVGNLYSKLTSLSSDLKVSQVVEACMWLCRVKEFEAERLLGGAVRCREKLVKYSTRDAYLDLFEEVYNYGRSTKNLFALKIASQKAMSARNVARSKSMKG